MVHIGLSTAGKQICKGWEDMDMQAFSVHLLHFTENPYL